MAVGISMKASILIRVKGNNNRYPTQLNFLCFLLPPGFKVLTACLGLIVINLAVTIKSFAIILSFGVQPVAPVEFE